MGQKVWTNGPNSTSQLQILTLGTRNGLQNLPFRPGFPQETFLFLVSIYLIHISSDKQYASKMKLDRHSFQHIMFRQR